ncbi:MAG: hypothetical protein APF76_01820 [Desulfitibacter sp. BRH_c19]|nr:MAG: hypothetical protein APF76_01820 [Desulfitibacter sp. BRH_c19]
MFCDECKKRPAAVHITKIINSAKSEVNLCEECAKKYQQELGFSFADNFSIHKFLTGLLEAGGNDASMGEELQETVKCEKCGADYRQFQQSGRFGCAKCYDSFGNKINVLLKRVHGSNIHAGKFPKRTGSDLRIKQEIKSLRNKLQSLVLEEEFEKAVEVRDKIRDLEKSIEPKGEI